MEKCNRCGYEWESRVRAKGKRPKSCPECKRRDWDIEIDKEPEKRNAKKSP